MVSGASGAIEALGHQQVVCFYSLFCNTALAKNWSNQKIKKKDEMVFFEETPVVKCKQGEH